MRPRVLLPLLLALTASPSCKKAGDAPSPAADAGPRAHDSLAPPSQAELPTTDGAISLGNLAGQIDFLTAGGPVRPGEAGPGARAVPLLLTRFQYLGRISDAERASA